MNEIDLYGPPGTGKTTRLTRLALSAVATLGGPERLGAVTYTRTAATELKGRIAQTLGIGVPADPRVARRTLDASIPWVGTIHSLCYKLLGRPPAITAKDLLDFAHSVDPRAKMETRVPDVETVEGFEFSDVAAQGEVERALQLHAMARHRMVTMEQAFRMVAMRSDLNASSPERLMAIASRYEQFKVDIGKIDFEDMLFLGGDVQLPVNVLFCDEVQDNSALLWSVIDRWSHQGSGVTYLVNAGDPWQAIYLFSGASPELFRKREGQWTTIGNSHRLSGSSARYALDLLRYAGYAEDSLLSTWTGVGGEPKENGSQFYLARTNALLRPVRESLEDRGTPYRLLRGIGPLQMKAAQTFRAWHKEGAGSELISYGTAALIADQAPSGSFPRGFKATYERMGIEDPEILVPNDDMGMLRDAIKRIYNYPYYERLLKMHGIPGFILPPRVQVGTIHAAKGREADEVTVVRSWGWLPGRAMLDGHQLEEACVAYVAATRHRSKLTFLDGFEGIPYPFPGKYGENMGDNY